MVNHGGRHHHGLLPHYIITVVAGRSSHGATMNMSGGLITAPLPRARECGTACRCRNASKLIMSGTAAITGNAGGGVQLFNNSGESGTLEVSGNAQITGNTYNGVASNVTIRAAQASSATKYIKVTGTLGTSANIGVTVQTADHVKGTAFASGTDTYTATDSDASYFHDDLTPQLTLNRTGRRTHRGRRLLAHGHEDRKRSLGRPHTLV